MTGFFREMVKCIAVSILAVLMALLVGGALWAAEGFPLPGKSAEAVAEAGQDSPKHGWGERREAVGGGADGHGGAADGAG